MHKILEVPSSVCLCLQCEVQSAHSLCERMTAIDSVTFCELAIAPQHHLVVRGLLPHPAQKSQALSVDCISLHIESHMKMEGLKHTSSEPSSPRRIHKDLNGPSKTPPVHPYLTCFFCSFADMCFRCNRPIMEWQSGPLTCPASLVFVDICRPITAQMHPSSMHTGKPHKENQREPGRILCIVMHCPFSAKEVMWLA